MILPFPSHLVRAGGRLFVDLLKLVGALHGLNVSRNVLIRSLEERRKEYILEQTESLTLHLPHVAGCQGPNGNEGTGNVPERGKMLLV